ncbi:hypothetical protein NPIL_300541 [Nephila pilipes]|uniref:Uncharacterized protein n=1 Tax=Nephila pilipes TaxID=299642 RepID=A0A8X6QPH2_NEPPI|nr:hypothetical protein NPIL_300541 [Nephila pilipes]
MHNNATQHGHYDCSRTIPWPLSQTPLSIPLAKSRDKSPYLEGKTVPKTQTISLLHSHAVVTLIPCFWIYKSPLLRRGWRERFLVCFLQGMGWGKCSCYVLLQSSCLDFPSCRLHLVAEVGHIINN